MPNGYTSKTNSLHQWLQLQESSQHTSTSTAKHTQTINHDNKYKYSHLQQAKQAKRMTNYPSAIILAQIILYRMTKTETLLHPKQNDNNRITD